MPTFPLADIQRIETAGANTANSSGTTIFASVSTNTKGSYAQLIASTSFPSRGIIITITNPQGGHDYLVDIAIGAAAAEQVIISNLVAGGATANGDFSYFFPLEIAAGSRIAVRCQSTTSAGSCRVSVLLLGGGFAQAEGFVGIETMGDNTADSGGTSIDPGGTINTKGSYSQLAASCTHALRMLVLGVGNQQNTIRSDANWLLDIAIGGAGSEQILVANLAIHSSSAADAVLPCVFLLPINIPSGSRIAIRAQCSINDATDRLFDVVLYGVY